MAPPLLICPRIAPLRPVVPTAGGPGQDTMSESASRDLILPDTGTARLERAQPPAETGAALPAPPGAGSLRTFTPPRAKRVIDILGAVLLIALCAPLGALIAVAIKLDTPGPVIYRQERVGLNRRRIARRRSSAPVPSNLRRVDRRVVSAEGRPFTMYKFRTMVAHAERDVGPVWALKDDPRITRVGRCLRATRLDELPQLWNVLRGNMSLVGPRPERPFFVSRFARHIPGYPSRLYTHPGITGLAQVEHRYDASEDDVRIKLGYDLTYIERYSLLADLRILAKTALVMITRKGAH
jgi:lipopolysaccharide/colanic/teichoic acid biosynthesis glycosyltransferase